MGQGSATSHNKQKAIAEGKGSLAINAAEYSNVTVYQYVTYEGGRATSRETTDPAECPYPGLETFRTSEAKYFAGREEDVALLEIKLSDHDICGVIAASGAGKSSLVHAGLIPALEKRESEVWDVFAFKPGQEPLYGLARSMSGVLAQGDNLDAQLNEIRGSVENLQARHGRLSEYVEEIIRRRAGTTSGKRHQVLIFIDQWEELYTRENDKDRDILVRELTEVAERRLAKVLLTMRIDFMEEMLLLSTDFFRALKPGIHYVEPMDETGLRSAIEVPARKAGLGVPEALTSRLIADLGKGRDHGSLPYLQFVLRQLWEKRDQVSNSLTTEAYDGMKGLKGAIGTHADAVFRGLAKEEQGLAQRVLPRLANVSEAGSITSRRLRFADFDEPARQLLRKLAEPDRRLIVLSSATEEVAEAEIVAEVAHEALLDDWTRLSGWIADRKDFFRLRNKLEADAKTWIENERRNDFLIPAGKPLLDAEDLSVKALEGDISKDLKDFVEASGGRARSRKWLTRGLLTAVVASIAGIAIYLANVNQDLAEQTLAGAKARFESEVRLAGNLAPNGTSEAWVVLTNATKALTETVGEASALDSMGADFLTVALQALINQRAFQTPIPTDESNQILGFSPNGSTLVVAQDRDLVIISAHTAEFKKRFEEIGEPVLFWPMEGKWVGVIVCADAPCLFQEALLAYHDGGYDGAEAFKAAYSAYMGVGHQGNWNEAELWENLQDLEAQILRDIERKKIKFVLLDTQAQVANSYAISVCGSQFCIGNSEGRIGSVNLSEGPNTDLVGYLAGSRMLMPLRIESGAAWIGRQPDHPDQSFELPPTYELDPNSETTDEIYSVGGVVVRTSFTSTLVEIFKLDATREWRRSSVCLEFDELENQCAGGLIGAIAHDISADGKLVLVSSHNQGTGGGNGEHQTVLINTDTGTVVWRSDVVISLAAFAPDGSTFAIVDWLGSLEVRSVASLDIVYVHEELLEFRGQSVVFRYHPDLPSAVLREPNGNIALLDLSPTTDIANTTNPDNS